MAHLVLRKPRGRLTDKCPASGYQIVGRDFYTVSIKNGVQVCDCCGREIKLREFNERTYIPAHNKTKK